MNSKGTITVMVAGCLTALIGLSALAIDGGFAFITRNQLQNIGDAAALAGGRKLGKIYEGLSQSAQQSYTLNSTDRAAIITYMNAVAMQNTAGGIAIPISDDSNVVQIGHWNGTTFTATSSHPDAVHVTARRDSIANGSLSTLLAGIIGVSQLSVSASSTAAMTALNNLGAGKLDCPVGVPKSYAGSGGQCTNLVFSGTGQCAYWHTYKDSPASTNALKGLLDDGNNNGKKPPVPNLKAGTYPIPAVQAGIDQFYITNGALKAAFDDFVNLYNSKKDAQGKWNTWIVILDIQPCNGLSGATSIYGFTPATITGVDAGSKTVNGTVNCNTVQSGAGSGGQFGALGSVPSLVE